MLELLYEFLIQCFQLNVILLHLIVQNVFCTGFWKKKKKNNNYDFQSYKLDF